MQVSASHLLTHRKTGLARQGDRGARWRGSKWMYDLPRVPNSLVPLFFRQPEVLRRFELWFRGENVSACLSVLSGLGDGDWKLGADGASVPDGRGGACEWMGGLGAGGGFFCARASQELRDECVRW